MSIKKNPIDPQRRRRPPPSGFAWIDRRVLKDGWLASLEREAALLYFFLALVSDHDGMSFWSDPAVQRVLDLDIAELVRARAILTARGLILYRYPLYQLLPVPQRDRNQPLARRPHSRARDNGPPLLLAEILQRASKAIGRPAPPQRPLE
jgi:hypothetical protein